MMPTSLQQWVNEEIYRQYKPVIRRIPRPPSYLVSVDYDIEFRWANTFELPWDESEHHLPLFDVLAHLHVRESYYTDRNLPAGPRLGGIWVEDLNGSGMNLNQMDGRNNFRDWMLQFVE